jgi:hypothetical protein
MNTELLESLGVSAHLPAAEKAAALIRLVPIRYEAKIGHRDPATVLESRWFAGVSECLNVLSEVYRGSVQRGTAFGTTWPYMIAGGRVVAPALPVAVGEVETTGPDGCYELREAVVWREAVGEDRPLLVLESPMAAAGTDIDLMWFGDGERYVLRGGVLEVEDLFSVLRCHATAPVIDRLLIRNLRVDPDAVDGLQFGEVGEPSEIEVRRSRDLIADEGWLDAARVLRVREDVVGVERRHDQLVVSTARNDNVIFNAVQEKRGWRLHKWEGKYPFGSLRLTERDDVLCYSGTIDRAVDPLAPGVRGRLAFDLKSNLVALGA